MHIKSDVHQKKSDCQLKWKINLRCLEANHCLIWEGTYLNNTHGLSYKLPRSKFKGEFGWGDY